MPSRSYCARAVLAIASVFLAACGDDPQVPTAAVPVQTTAFVGRVNIVLQQAPTVRITDQRGRNIRGLLVRWRVTSGGGRVSSDTVRTDGSGVASSGGWVLGTEAGTQTLEASVDGLPPTVFTATAIPGPLAQVVATNAATQVAEVNTDVPVRPSIRAMDQFDNPIPGLPVTFTVVQGTGSVTGGTPFTDANGVATVGSWRLGTVAGAQRLRATVADQGLGTTSSVDISAIAQPAAPFDLRAIAGANQSATFGAIAPIAPGVRVIDAWGNGVGNVPVTFTPGPNSGTVSSGEVTSDPANGSAFVGAWTLGPTASTQTLVATSPSLPGRSATFTASVGTSQFDIDVRFIGTVTNPLVRQAFLTAAAKWKTVITGALHRTIVINAAGACDSWIPPINDTIKDVRIYARVVRIDGPGDSTGNILGQAGPCAVNAGTRLTTYGLMEFDEFDLDQLVADGSLVDVIVHEMGHVLGIGTLWSFTRPLLVGAGTDDPFFEGTAARTQFAILNTSTYSGTPVPVENSGGAGTRDSHWRESILRNELMTGFLNRGSNPLSRISVGSLQDLGYTVNLTAADGFSFVAPLYRFPVDGGSARRLYKDVKPLPLQSIDAQGRATRVRR